MRPFIVEAFDEVIELGLLLEKVAAGRLGGLELQGEMHAVMASVLLARSAVPKATSALRPAQT